jgi:hypothetical protein
MPGMGRLPAPDPRDRRFLARRAMAAVSPPRHDQEWEYRAAILNQRQTGTCVGHGWKEYLLAEPDPTGTPHRRPTPFQIYDWAIKHDEWTDNDRDRKRQFGTSVRAGAKALSAFGYLRTDEVYAWAFDVDTAIDWLVNHGPVVIGVSWYRAMMDTDDQLERRIREEGEVCMIAKLPPAA